MDVQCSAASWSFKPCKRLFPMRHPFFEEGDLFCNVLIKQIFLSVDEVNYHSEETLQCDFTGCNKRFLTLANYEAHYNSLHRNTCQKCSRTFPSNFLLDLHIMESHDVLFKLSHAKYMFRCLIESCPDKFSSDVERKDHLVIVHKYPADFRFNRPSRKQRKLTKNYTEPMDTTLDQTMQTKKKTKKMESSADAGMDASDPCSRSKRTPKTICFGRGSMKAFERRTNKR